MTLLQNRATNILLNLFHKSGGPLATILFGHSVTNKLNVHSTTAVRQKCQKLRVADQNYFQCKLK